jgi:hypothetical protein
MPELAVARHDAMAAQQAAAELRRAAANGRRGVRWRGSGLCGGGVEQLMGSGCTTICITVIAVSWRTHTKRMADIISACRR